MKESHFIKFQYQCLLTDAKFADFDQVCRLYLEKESNSCFLSDFQHELLNTISSMKYSEAVLNDYSNDDWIKNRIQFIRNSINKFWDTEINNKVYIVDEFPGNIAHSSWKAMSVDYNQAQYYSIKEGIYYKSDYVVPFLFEFLVAHEFMHHVLYKVSSHFNSIVTSLTEEGLCDFFAYLVLVDSGIDFDKKCFIKFMLSNRSLCSRTNYIRYAYWLFSYKVCVLYLKHGKTEFLNRYIFKGETINISVDDVAFQRQIDEKHLFLYNCFFNSPSEIVLSENEFVVFRAIYRNEFNFDILKEENADSNKMKDIVNRLQNMWLITVCDDGAVCNVDMDNVYFYLNDWNVE